MRFYDARPLLLTLLLTGCASPIGAAYDALTTPGVPVTLEAKFERDFGRYLRDDIVGRPVDISIDGRPFQTVRTDEQGLSSCVFVPAAPGVLTWTARLTDPELLVTGELRVIPAAREVIVFDIDGTLSDLPELLVPFAGARAAAYPGAAELVRDLASRYAIVYLTARDDTFLPETNEFLRRHNFPDGTLIFNEYGRREGTGDQRWPWNHGRFKVDALRSLQNRGLTLRAGVGNAPTDTEAYRAVGIPPYIREGGEGSIPFDSYAQLRKRFIREGWLGN